MSEGSMRERILWGRIERVLLGSREKSAEKTVLIERRPEIATREGD